MVSIPAQAPRSPENQPRRDLVPVADASVEQYKRPQFLDNVDRSAAAPNAPDRKSGNRLRWAAIGAIGATATLIGLGVYATNEAPKRITGESGADPNISEPSSNNGLAYEKHPVKLLAEKATGDQFANLDADYPYEYTLAEQLDYVGPKLNKDPHVTVEKMRSIMGSSHFTGEDGVTPRAIAAPSLSNTPQEIADQIAVGMFKAWEVAQTGDIDEAKKYAAGVADPESYGYTNQIDAFSNSVGNFTEAVAWDEQPLITSGEYEGIVATTENPIMKFNTTSTMDTNVKREIVVQFGKGTNEDSARWRQVVLNNI